MAAYCVGCSNVDNNSSLKAVFTKVARDCVDSSFVISNVIVTKVPVTNASKAFIKKAIDLESKRFTNRGKQNKQSEPMRLLTNVKR
ncbi:hypothetical protein AGMMS49593_09640 [Endomicrobiia bacterium]|nr:hypothetical protein AGMMS49593_09640 [Endomicrobiia bacterium]